MDELKQKLSKLSGRLSANRWMLVLYFLSYFLIKYGFEFTRTHYAFPYLTYLIDLVFIAFGYVIFFLDFRLYSRFKKRYAAEIGIFFLLGYLTYFLSVQFFTRIPIDFYNPTNVFLLTVFGPTIEEFLFRFCFLLVLIRLVRKVYLALILSALVFSVAHLMALFHVPSSLYSFIAFQGAYTFIVGLYWAHRYLGHRALIWPVLLHIGFNVGFYCGWLFPVVE